MSRSTGPLTLIVRSNDPSMSSQAAQSSTATTQIAGRAAILATVAHLLEPHDKALAEIAERMAALAPKLDVGIEKINGSKKVTGLLADAVMRAS